MAEKIDLFTADGGRKYLTSDERQDFIGEANKLPDRAVRSFCLTLAHTGCRISEALALIPRRVDLAGGQIVIRSLKKRGKLHHRAVSVSPALLDALDLVHGIRQVQKDGKDRELDRPLWGFSRMTGWRRVVEVMQAADIEGAHASPKGLRHGFAVHALMHDIPLPLLQRWMGHAELDTTAIYLQVAGNEEKSLASRMWEDA